jgi:acyl transferase domain-containing protein
MAGLIKAVLVLEQRTIPPNLHFEEPNALLPLDRVSIPTTLTPLPVPNDGAPFVVGVNSFGFGGSNVHALLAAAPVAEEPCGENADEPCLLPVSARSPGALAEYAAAYAKFIDENPAVSLRELCSAAALGKSHHPLRHALVADSLAGLQTQLLAAQSTPSASARLKIAFVFSGQGPQWWGMGRRLFRREKTVRDIWEQCDATCRKLGGPKLLDELLADEAASRLNHTDIAQPALFTLQAGLVELWRAWGIEPDAVVGHSVGEAAAAWAAGVFDLEGIFRVILPRSRWQEKTHGQGRMLAAAISADDAKAWLQRFAHRVSLAAVNAPRQVTLSGDADALEEIASALKKAEIFNRFLATEYAFHSEQMDSLQEGLQHDLAGIAGAEAKIPMISTVTGEPVRGPEMDANYWWRNVREPVHFADSIAHLLRDGCTALIEIGPHPVMAAALAEIVLAEKSPAISVASLRRTGDELSTMLHALGTLYQRGAAVRWDSLYAQPRRALRLPAYPWQRQHLWREFHGTAREFRDAPPHPLLGDRQPHPQPTWIGQLDVRTLPWLTDHCITGAAVVPAAVYLEMATAAVRELLGEPTVFFEDIKFHHLLFLPDERPVPTCVRLDLSTSTFQVLTARPDLPDEWEVQADGIFRPGRLHVPPRVDLDTLLLQLPEERDPRALYRDLRDIGQIYGPMFQGITSLRVRAEQAVLAAVRSPTERAWPDYTLFPPAIDSCFQSSFAIRRREDDRAVVIMSCRQLRIFQPLPDTFFSHLGLVQHWKNSHAGDLTVFAPDGSVLAEFISLRLLAIEAASKPGQRDRKYYGLAWEPQPPPQWQRAAEEVLIFADRGTFAESLAASLGEQGARATLVSRDGGRNGATLGVNLRQKDWAIRLWKTLAARGPLPTRILYLWNWDDDEADGCAAFLALTQARLALPGSEEPARWLVVTSHAQAIDANEDLAPATAAIWGFARSVQTEQPQWRLALMDCADDSCGDEVLSELFAEENEPEVALREDGRRVRRLRYIQPRNSARADRPPALALHLEQTGRIDSLQFRGQARAVPGRGEIEVEVAAAGLNFRDLMKALGIYPLNEDEAVHLGDEFAGRIVRVGRGVRKLRVGDRVMGLAPAGGAFGSHLISAADAVWKIPAQLSFAEAASIPVGLRHRVSCAAHAGAVAARRDRAHPRRGRLASVSPRCNSRTGIGATVLATAGSEEKARLPRSLGVAHVMDSARSISPTSAAPHRRARRGCRAQFARRRVSAKEPRGLRAARTLRGNRQARSLRKQLAAPRRLSALALVFCVRSRLRARVARRGTRRAATVSRPRKFLADSLRAVSRERCRRRISPDASRAAHR